MKKIFVGHRGAGKSTLLKRHKLYFPKVPHFDLDNEIEVQTESSIPEIFQKKGELFFRDTEQKVFQKLVSENSEFVICVGAGFDITKISKEIETIFVRRVTDRNGRLFLNRPRLDQNKSSLEEYYVRYEQRQQVFLELSDEVYDLPEGLDHLFRVTEKKIFSESLNIEDAIYTITRNEIGSLKTLTKRYSKIELRTDLIDLSEIQKILLDYSYSRFLVSFRSYPEKKLEGFNEKLVDLDWESDLGEMPEWIKSHQGLILSTHINQIDEAIESLNQYLRHLQNYPHLKISSLITNFDELRKGYDWQQSDKENRSFLPRSYDGKWLWYRQLGKYQQKLNFIRNRTGLLDQPSIYQWLSLPSAQPAQWAAVFGSPVQHSFTPTEQEDFFKKHNTFVTAIDFPKDSTIEDFNLLQQLGLTYAAVTSPQKEFFYVLANIKSDEAEDLKSVNTIMIQDKKILAHNTDLEGFRKLIEPYNIKNSEVVLWGGGGTIKVVQNVIPNVKNYSSSQSKPRSLTDLAIRPTVLIWASPRAEQTKFPPIDWPLELIIDLNYVDNSMGLELAQQRKIKYVSGLEMFKTQAFEQRIFWSKKD